MQCPQCQHENRDTAKFCEACGSPLALRCPSCDNEVRPGATFCDHCGTRLSRAMPTPPETQPIKLDEPPTTEPPTADAERRQLTVMFCDLVDSTVLAGQLDPEDLREVVREYQQVCSEIINRFDGHVRPTPR